MLHINNETLTLCLHLVAVYNIFRSSTKRENTFTDEISQISKTVEWLLLKVQSAIVRSFYQFLSHLMSGKEQKCLTCTHGHSQQRSNGPSWGFPWSSLYSPHALSKKSGCRAIHSISADDEYHIGTTLCFHAFKITQFSGLEERDPVDN